MKHDKRCVTIKAVSMMLCVSEDSLVSCIDLMRLIDDANKAGFKHDNPKVIKLVATINKMKSDYEHRISETL
jgi:hypothetical protein